MRPHLRHRWPLVLKLANEMSHLHQHHHVALFRNLPTVYSSSIIRSCIEEKCDCGATNDDASNVSSDFKSSEPTTNGRGCREASWRLHTMPSMQLFFDLQYSLLSVSNRMGAAAISYHFHAAAVDLLTPTTNLARHLYSPVLVSDKATSNYHTNTSQRFS